jgi:hypothetical protein
MCWTSELGARDGKHTVASNVPVVAVDKRTGKMVFEMNRPDLPPFYALDVPADGRRARFTSPALRILFRVEDAGRKAHFFCEPFAGGERLESVRRGGRRDEAYARRTRPERER